jgi:hypothetical protein
MFHGEGTLFVKGGYYKGEFEQGKLVEGNFVCTDGLDCEELSEWAYCSQDDYRFKIEIDEGVELDGPLRYTTAYPDPAPLPYGCYDMEEGFYDPKEEAIFSYGEDREKIRNVESEEEREWIVNNCRVGITMDEGAGAGKGTEDEEGKEEESKS